MDPLLAHFGTAVRRYRDLLRISQEELADRASLDRTYVSGVERGQRNPTLKTVERLAAALRVEIEVLFATTREIRQSASGRQR